LNEAEKQAILKYIEYLNDSPNPGGLEPGRYGPVTEGLFLWTIGIGALLMVAIWIGVKAK
jgi:ubiquinol-cytochrome c reductase cytochrome c subunit